MWIDFQTFQNAIQTLEDKKRPYYVRGDAAKWLGENNERRGIIFLKKALGDKESYVRQEALKALCHLGGESVASSLYMIVANRNEHWMMRCDAARGLGKTGSSTMVEPLLKILAGPSVADKLEDNVRGSVAEALGQIGDLRALPALGKIVANPHESLRVGHEAAKALGKLGHSAAVEWLQTAFVNKKTPSITRYRAGDSLGKLGFEAAVPALLQVLNDSSEKDTCCRTVAAEALGEIRSPKAYGDLYAWVEAGFDNGLTSACVKSLGQITTKTLKLMEESFIQPNQKPNPQWLTDAIEEALSSIETTIGIEMEKLVNNKLAGLCRGQRKTDAMQPGNS